MPAKPVEWVLVIFYGPSAHRATYGRLDNTKYTKDFIQLSRKAEFLEAVSSIFPVVGGEGSIPLTYQWPADSTTGAFVFRSADRPHLKWETNLGAPKAWKMAVNTSETTAETIPGDPSHLDFESAEKELALLESRGAGQPYLVAVKLRDEPNKLHLRAYLGNPQEAFAWANLDLVPDAIRSLAAKTSQRSAISWTKMLSGGVLPSTKVSEAISQIAETTDPLSVVNRLDEDTSRALANYISQPGYGVFFDAARNHDAWLPTAPLHQTIRERTNEILAALGARFPLRSLDDATAEQMESDSNEVESFRNQIESNSFNVPDSTATIKTRGSAQKAFADAVKSNYGMCCAVTGIKTRDFLVASHIVPWSIDQNIRLDPTNGICLSLLADRAFEKGYLIIEDDYSIRIDLDRIGQDAFLRSQLEPYNGIKLKTPADGPPRIEYLQRRRAMIAVPS